MTKQLEFYSEFQRVTVIANGDPLSLNAEVFITIKRPAKLDRQSKLAWAKLTGESTMAATCETVPFGKEGA